MVTFREIKVRLKSLHLRWQKHCRICKEFSEEIKAQETREEKIARYIGYVASAVTSIITVLVLSRLGIIQL